MSSTPRQLPKDCPTGACALLRAADKPAFVTPPCHQGYLPAPPLPGFPTPLFKRLPLFICTDKRGNDDLTCLMEVSFVPVGLSGQLGKQEAVTVRASGMPARVAEKTRNPRMVMYKSTQTDKILAPRSREVYRPSEFLGYTHNLNSMM